MMYTKDASQHIDIEAKVCTQFLDIGIKNVKIYYNHNFMSDYVII